MTVRVEMCEYFVFDLVHGWYKEVHTLPVSLSQFCTSQQVHNCERSISTDQLHRRTPFKTISQKQTLSINFTNGGHQLLLPVICA